MAVNLGLTSGLGNCSSPEAFPFVRKRLPGGVGGVRSSGPQDVSPLPASRSFSPVMPCLQHIVPCWDFFEYTTSGVSFLCLKVPFCPRGSLAAQARVCWGCGSLVWLSRVEEIVLSEWVAFCLLALF